jgi:hypothetical protein
MVVSIIIFYQFQQRGGIAFRIIISMMRFAHVYRLRCVQDILFCALSG